MKKSYQLFFLIFVFSLMSCGAASDLVDSLGGEASEPTITTGGDFVIDCGSNDTSDYCENVSEYNLSGVAFKDSEDNLVIVLNPLMQQTEGEADTNLTEDEITVKHDDQEYEDITVEQIQDAASTYDADVVFILDTTGSMAWAIDGVKDSLIEFADSLIEYGLDPNIGGVEYGDDTRTSLDLTTPESFKDWVEGLSATGGGDAAENPLDAYLYAYNNFSFSDNAIRYFILVTDQGYHTDDDGSDYTSYDLGDLIDAMKGSVLHGVIHAQISGTDVSGEHPKTITDTMGGIYVNIEFDLLSYLESFSFDLTTTDIDLEMEYTYVVSVPASEAASLTTGDTVTVEYTVDGTTYETTLTI